MLKYTCWHGEADDRYDSKEIEASGPDRAAQEFALEADDGEDYDIVYVLVGDKIYEYKCRYRREITCVANLTKRHEVEP